MYRRRPPQSQVPPQAAGPTPRGPRGGPRAAARASGGGAPLRPVAGVSPHQPEALRPLPALSPEVLPRRIHYPRGTCRSSSLRYQAAKRRETSQLIARDFPQHGALERARDGAQALLLAAQRARSSENRP